MYLTGKQTEQLQDTFLDAYDRSELEQFVSFKFEEQLDNITSGGDNRQTVFELIEWAKRRDQLGDLIQAACEDRPSNSIFAELNSKLLEQPQQHVTHSDAEPEEAEEADREPSAISIGPSIKKELKPYQRKLLARAFHAHESPRVEGELGGGLSDARVFIVRFKNRPSVVAKIDSVENIEREAEANNKYVSFIASSYRVQLREGGVLYDRENDCGVLVADLAADKTDDSISLRDFFEKHGGSKATDSLSKLFDACHTRWWGGHSETRTVLLAKDYDRLLPVHVWGDMCDSPSGVHRIFRSEKFTMADLSSLEVLEKIEAQYFQVAKHGINSVTLYAASADHHEPILRFRIQKPTPIDALKVGEIVDSLSISVQKTRETFLTDEYTKAWEAAAILDTLGTLSAQDRQEFPTPVSSLQDLLLAEVGQIKYSIIHGDLNLANILLERDIGSPWLIDFAKTGMGPTLLDFQRLEVEAIAHLLPTELSKCGLTASSLVDLLNSLHAESHPPNSPIESLQNFYQLHCFIRNRAEHYLFDPKAWDEYYRGLVIALLGALKFKNLAEPSKALLAVAASATLRLVGTPLSKEPMDRTASMGFEDLDNPSDAFPRVNRFVGREHELTYYQKSLLSENIAILTGLPGIGKSALGSCLASKFQLEGRNVFWYNCRSKGTIQDIFVRLFDYLDYLGDPSFKNRLDLWRSAVPSMAESESPPIPVVAAILDLKLISEIFRTLGKHRVLVCLDDFHNLQADGGTLSTDTLLDEIEIALDRGEIQFMLISQELIPLQDEYDIKEMKGLNDHDARLLLKQQGLQVEPSELERDLLNKLAGNAALLRYSASILADDIEPTEDVINRLLEAGQPRRFLKKNIGLRVKGIDREIMKAVSVLLDLGGPLSVIQSILPKQSSAQEKKRGQHLLERLRQLVEWYLIEALPVGRSHEYLQRAFLQEFYYLSLKPDEQQAMHTAAAKIYQQDNQPLRAAFHYCYAELFEESARLIATDIREYAANAETSLLRSIFAKIELGQLPLNLQIRLSFARGQLETYLGNTDVAKAIYEDAIKKWDLVGDETVESDRTVLQFCRALAYLLRDSKPDEAEGWAKKGLRLLAQSPDLELRADLLIQLGRIYQRKRKFEQARSHFDTALDLLSDEPPILLQVHALMGIAAVDYRGGQVDDSRRTFVKAREVAQKIGAVLDELAISVNLATIMMDAGDLDEAVSLYENAEKKAKKYAMESYLPTILVNWGVASLYKNDYQMAESLLTEGEQKAQDVSDVPLNIAAACYLSMLYLEQEKFDSALQRIAYAEEQMTQNPVSILQPMLYYTRAEYWLAKNDYTKAGEYARRAINQSTDQMAREKGIALRILGKVELARQHQHEANDYFAESAKALAQYPVELARTYQEQSSSLP